jgi:hypothetical protein
MRAFQKTYWFGLVCAVAFAGCRKDEEIKVYEVVKDAPTPAAAPSAPANPHAGMAVPDGGAPGAMAPEAPVRPVPPSKRIGMVPGNWQPGGGSSMRRASYRIAGEGNSVADVSLIILSGGAGGVLGNINRWREQLGLDPIKTEDLETAVEMMQTKCGDAAVVDIEGIVPGGNPASDGRTVAAIVELPEETWFFKMRGNAKLVASEKQRFLDWVASVEPAEVKSQ